MSISNNFRDKDAKSWDENALDSGVDRRVTDKSTQDILKNDITNTIDTGVAFNLTRSAGFDSGESYNKIITADVDNKKLMQYELDGICQFQITIDQNSGNYTIEKRACEFNLLQENGFNLLQEDGDIIKTQGLTPV